MADLKQIGRCLLELRELSVSGSAEMSIGAEALELLSLRPWLTGFKLEVELDALRVRSEADHG